jgi:hypothetical protein
VYYSRRDRDSEGGGDELTEAVIRQVTGASTKVLFPFHGAPPGDVALDVDQGRIALAWRGRGEIRSLTGRVVASFKFRGSAAAVALDGGTVAVLTYRPNDVKTIEVFDARTGGSLGVRRVSPNVMSLSAGAGWIVYGEDRSSRTPAQDTHAIRGFKAGKKSVQLYLRTKGSPIGVSVAGRDVAWAENERRLGRIRAFALPR